MHVAQLTITVFNSLVAALLLFASSAKLVSPAILARSLFLLTQRKSLSAVAAVRAIGVAEAFVAVGLMLPTLRLESAAALGIFGIAFSLSGVLARIRHLQEPCGCFGVISHRPLGWLNVILGAMIICDSILNFIISPGSEYVAIIPVTSGILLCSIHLAAAPRVTRAVSR
jgi:hypothetical protein